MSQSLLPTPASAPTPAPEPTAAAATATTMPSIAKPDKSLTDYLWQALTGLASLRLTVVLFAMALVLVFYGTWAQVDKSVWTVVSTYFRSYGIVWIPLNVVLLRTVDVPGAIPYPGGWLLGGLLLFNLLAAHLIRFKMTWARSGIFLIHAGIILMMLGELITGLYQVESHMTITEGGSTVFVENWLRVEIAVINRDDPATDLVFTVPGSRLRPGARISHAEWPFDIEVIDYMRNSGYREGRPDPTVTAGIGLQDSVVERPEVSGTDRDQVKDAPSAHVRLLDKQTGKQIDVLLLTRLLNLNQPVTVEGKKFELALRAEREYRDYAVHLIKAEYKSHPGTTMAQKYASEVRVVNPKTGEDRRVRIDMNQPLYYAGETFFQAGMHTRETPDPAVPSISILQVVRNPGWWMPYGSCIIVALGMIIHFGLHLNKFLKRRLAS